MVGPHAWRLPATTARILGQRALTRLAWALAGLGPVLILVAGCGSTTATPLPQTSTVAPPSQTITLGDIDSEEPVKKIKRFTPLAEYLAERLESFGITQGRVVIANDIEEMGRLLRDGTVDIFFDSPFPTLAVQDLSGSEIILRRWKGGIPTYWSTYVSLRGGGISGVEDFAGKVMAFEKPHSSSGFVLPAGTLIERGYTLVEVDGPDAVRGGLVCLNSAARFDKWNHAAVR